MKTSVVLFSWVGAATALVVNGPEDWKAAPQGERILPALDKTEPIDGAKRREILYGPWAVNTMQMIAAQAFIAESPCANCYVTAMQATLKYLNGTEASTSSGLYLHHTIISDANPLGEGRLWSAGNERPTIRLNTDGNRFGIDFPRLLSYSADIMSERKDDVEVNISVTYEYIEKDTQMGSQYKDIKLHWTRIENVVPPNGQASFYLRSKEWTSNVNGKLLYAIGHMHDGGTHQTLLINNRLVCNSTMFYGRRAGYEGLRGTQSGHEHPRPSLSAPEVSAVWDKEIGENSGLERRALGRREDILTELSGDAPYGSHISDPGACTNFATIRKGDVLTSEAFYDFTIHQTMRHDGRFESLMGNMRVYIGPD